MLEREIVGLIGPNGSGKTTFSTSSPAICRRTRAQIRFCGEELAGLRPFQIARKGIARTFQVTRIFPKMTLIENLRCRREVAVAIAMARAEALLELVGLAELRDEYATIFRSGSSGCSRSSRC